MTVNDGSTGSAKTKKYVVFSVNNDNEPLFILASDFKNNSRIYFDTCIKFALIFEDDIAFDPKELKATIDDLLNNKELWDINLFEIHHSGMPLSIKKLSNYRDLSIYLARVSHAGAYIINRKAAKNMLEKALPIIMPVDHYFTRNWELDLKFTGIEPRIVRQSFGDSDISKTDKMEEESVGFVRSIKRAMYETQGAIIRFLYNFYMFVRS